MKISPSILSCDFSKMGEELKTIETAEYVHIDVMDGMFVPNLTFGAPVVKDIRKTSKKVFDVHLMIEEPIRYIKDFAEAGSDIITVHIEACSDIKKTLEEIKKHNVKCGIAIKPNTEVSVIEEYLPELDMVLVMSVEPGFGGQSFIESSVEKVALLKKLKDENGYNYEINIDGGINLETGKRVVDAGVDVLVAGSFIFNNDREESIKNLRNLKK